MLLYHVAGSLLLFRYIFRDPKVDVRMLALGAVLPNLVDKPAGTLLWADYFGADRIFGHSLLFPTVIMIGALLATRRGRRRRAIMAVAIGAMLHLLLDGMWTSASTFFWPFFGWDFEPGRSNYWADLGEIFSVSVLVKEALGAAYLVYLYRKLRLGEPETRQAVLATGRLPI